MTDLFASTDLTIILPVDSGDPFPVNARDVHRALEVGRDFSNWIKARIAEGRFIGGRDFVTREAAPGAHANSGEWAQSGIAGAPRRIDYHLTLDMGKMLGMMEKSGPGDRIRRYFIEVEKRAAHPAVPTNLADALQLAADIERERVALAAKVASDAPKVALADAVMATADTYTASQVAKLLGVQPSRLIAAYEKHRWYYREGERLRACAERITDGHCVERMSAARDGDRVFITPRVTGTGLDLTRKRLAAWGLVITLPE